MCVCKVILLFVNECECKEKNKCECKEYISVNARKLKVGGIFLSLAIHVSTPIFHFSYLILLPQKSSHFSYFLGCIRSEVQPLFLYSFSSFFVLLSLFFLCFYTAALPFSPTQYIPL